MGKVKKSTKKFIKKQQGVTKKETVQSKKQKQRRKARDEVLKREIEHEKNAKPIQNNENTEKQFQPELDLGFDDLGNESPSEMEEHMKELDNLKETDPEFYKHLEENASGLLEFGKQDLDVSDEDIESLKDNSENINLSLETLEAMRKSVWTDKSFRALKKLLVLFRLACNLHDEGEEEIEAQGIRIANAQVFQKVMDMCLGDLEEILFFHLEAENLTIASKSKGWNKMHKPLKWYCSNVVHFFASVTENLSENNTSMARFVISRLLRISGLLAEFPKTLGRLAKILFKVWSQAHDGSLRIDAFLLLQQLVLRCNAIGYTDFYENCLKNMYLSFVRNAKQVSAGKLSSVNFMINSLSEVYAMDMSQSYPHAFVYIRQLALHLRKAVLKPSKENKFAVYSWQFVNSLRAWGKMLCVNAKSKSSELRPLVYPFVQITLQTMDLVSSIHYCPLRLVCADMLNDICEHCDVYIPMSPSIVRVFGFKVFTERPVNATTKPVQFELVLKVSEAESKSKQYQEVVVEKCFNALRRHFTVFSRSIAFPELVFMTNKALTGFAKASKVSRFSKQAETLVQQLKHNSNWILSHRNKIDFAPKDIDKCLKFLSDCQEVSPLQQFDSVKGNIVQIDDSIDSFRGKFEKSTSEAVNENSDDDYKEMDEEIPLGEKDSMEEDIVEDFALSDDE